MLGSKHQKSSSWNTSNSTESPRHSQLTCTISRGNFLSGLKAPSKSLTLEGNKIVPAETSLQAGFPSISKKPLGQFPPMELKQPLGHKKTRSYSNPLGSIQLPALTKRRTKSNVLGFFAEPVVNCVSKCVYKSRPGMLNGLPKTHNQDSYIIKPHLKGVKGQYLFAVCDGHGPLGHHVSSLIKEYFVQYVEEALPLTPSSEAELSSALRAAIWRLEAAINNSGIDLDYSGSTLACCLLRGSILITANIGDSRAVIGQKRHKWGQCEVTRDHKPDVPSELLRIRQSGGRVEPAKDPRGFPVGCPRVWLKDIQRPGLAMSRALGDRVASMAGVTAEPELCTTYLKEHDKFLILATDGIWEFISSSEAVRVVKVPFEAGKPEACCELLVKESLNRWKRVDNTVDDITVIVLFFRSN